MFFPEINILFSKPFNVRFGMFFCPSIRRLYDEIVRGDTVFFEKLGYA